jgi:hypothetical protein
MENFTSVYATAHVFEENLLKKDEHEKMLREAAKMLAPK